VIYPVLTAFGLGILVGLAVGLLAGVVIGVNIVYTQEPATK
jgi:ribose/xylose/arabinose/galactoside ABC-type transport system permease subunit